MTLRQEFAISLSMSAMIPACVSVRVQHSPQLSAIHRIAVLAERNPPGQEEAGLLDAVVTELTGSEVTVVDREHLRIVLDEQDLQSIGLIDPQTAVKMGRLVGADAILLFGSLDGDYDYNRLVGGWAKMSCQFKMLDVERGTVIMAGRARLVLCTAPEPFFLGVPVVVWGVANGNRDFIERSHEEFESTGSDRAEGLPDLFFRSLGKSIRHEIEKSRIPGKQSRTVSTLVAQRTGST